MSFRAEGRDASVCVREAHARLEVEESLRIRRGVYSFDVIPSAARDLLFHSSRRAGEWESL
jgi:hypothetical protein